MLGVRVWELLVLLTWLGGLWLCLRHTRRAFVLGIYLSTTLTFGFDWLYGLHLWHMSFHPDTIWMFRWFGEPMALWSPLSYGFFFGIAAFVGLRYRGVLDARLGAWQYVLAFPTIFLLNVVVEGGAIEFWQVNTYHMPEEQLVFNLPWRHLLTTGTMFAGTLWLARNAYVFVERSGWSDFVDEPEGTANVVRGMRARLVLLGLSVPVAAFYFSFLIGMFIYSAFPVPDTRG